jgi:hypothetical protein
MPPNAERTSTAAGTEKEKQKMCRRARGGVRIWRKVDKRLEIVTDCGDRQECGRPARLKMVSVVGFIVPLLGC